MTTTALVPLARTNRWTPETLLQAPSADADLESLKDELNALAKIRYNARLSFCLRLASAYLLICNRPFSRKANHDGGTKKFCLWVRKNLRSANGKSYSDSTIRDYLAVGFNTDPAGWLRKKQHQQLARTRKMLRFASAVKKRIPLPPQPLPTLLQLEKRNRISSDVALEVNRLMTAWESASPLARETFFKLIS